MFQSVRSRAFCNARQGDENTITQVLQLEMVKDKLNKF